MSIKIALAGNPNCGKTTLFNALTGSNQYVGNWPGVTVEKKEGSLKKNSDITVVDLPGIYSLSPYTPEEIVARKFLVEVRPDVILNIVATPWHVWHRIVLVHSLSIHVGSNTITPLAKALSIEAHKGDGGVLQIC